MDHILTWVSTYGYGAIFGLLLLGIVGLPVPDEWLLVFTGYLIWKGRFHPVLGVLSGFCGAASGITLSYVIGRTLGLGFIHRYGRWFHVHDEQIERVHDWFRRIGHWALFIGYYVPGVRHFTAIVAGTSKLEFRAFAGYAWGGAFVWVCTFIAIGYSLGEQWQKVFEAIERNIHLVGMGLVVLAVLYAVLSLWRVRRR